MDWYWGGRISGLFHKPFLGRQAASSWQPTSRWWLMCARRRVEPHAGQVTALVSWMDVKLLFSLCFRLPFARAVLLYGWNMDAGLSHLLKQFESILLTSNRQKNMWKQMHSRSNRSPKILEYWRGRIPFSWKYVIRWKIIAFFLTQLKPKFPKLFIMTYFTRADFAKNRDICGQQWTN